IDKVHTEIDNKMKEFVKSRDDAIEKVNRTSKEAVKSAEESKKSSDNLTADVNKDRDSLATLHDDTKKMRDSVTVDIANMKKEFQANITEAKSAKTQAENNQRAIEKIQNSFFDIFVHFEGNIEQNNRIISDIIAKLNSEGFLISGKKNIIQVGVDVTEILYYNE